MNKKNNRLACEFGSSFRFVVDLFALNDGGKIYRSELQWKKSNENYMEHSFFDLEIKIRDKEIITKLYDKKDAFDFSIVRLPHRSSNLPSKIFFTFVGAEFLMMARATYDLEF